MAKNPIPKKIAGLKVPKGLRKSKMLRRLLKSDTGREILAGAVVAGASAFSAAIVRHREEVGHAAASGACTGARGAGFLGEAIQHATHAMVGVVGEAMHAAVPDRPRRGREGEGSSSQTGPATPKH